MQLWRLYLANSESESEGEGGHSCKEGFWEEQQLPRSGQARMDARSLRTLRADEERLMTQQPGIG